MSGRELHADARVRDMAALTEDIDMSRELVSPALQFWMSMDSALKAEAGLASDSLTNCHEESLDFVRAKKTRRGQANRSPS